MGLNGDMLAGVSPIVFDVETAPLPNAADYFEPVEPDARLVDPVKIAKSISDKTEAQQSKASLDYNVGRIVAIAWWTADQGLRSSLCRTEEDEARELSCFWLAAKQRTLVGACIKSFDLPWMIQRSRYLGVAAPVLDLGRYSRSDSITDLFHLLTFNDSQESFVMRRTVQQFCRRFGIPVEDTITGKEIPGLVAAGEWEKVLAHCEADVKLEVALARRLGVIQPEGVL